MAKKIIGFIKLQVPAGKANPRDDLREGRDDPYRPVEPWQEPPPGNRECGYHQGHPRDVRIIPKSRDFH